MKASLKTQACASYQEANSLMKRLEARGMEHTHIESVTSHMVVWAELESDTVVSSETPMKAEFGTHTNNLIVIEGTVISDQVFDCELVDYRLSSRPDRVDDLIRWISECKDDRTKPLMIADLVTLLAWDDEFIWDSISTNSFISPTHDSEHFNAICREVLAANQSVN